MTERENRSDFAAAIDRVRVTRAADASQDRYELVDAYRAASDLATTADELRELVCENLVPDCVLTDEVPGSGVRSALRSILADTLDSLPDDLLFAVRPAAIDQAARLAVTHPSEHAIYAMASVHYRAPAIVDTLRTLASRDHELADVALRVMAAMRVEGTDAEWLAQRISERLAEGHTGEELLNALATLVPAGALEALKRLASHLEDDWFVLARFGWLCDAEPGDAHRQDEITRAMVDVANSRPNGWAEAIFFGGLFDRFRSSLIITSIVDSMPKILARKDLHGFANRLKDLREPEHTRPILNGTIAPPRLDALREAAVMSTGPSTPATTEGSLLKSSAWNVVMFFASPNLYEWIEEAVSREESVYSQYELMERLSVLALPALPTRAMTLLSDRTLAFARDAQGPNVLPFLAAATLASSKADLPSLELLMRCGGLVDGSPFRTPVDDAAEAAVWLVERSAAGVVELLIDGLRSTSPMALSVTLTSMRVLAALPSTRAHFPPASVAALREVATDTTRRPHLRGDAMVALALVAAPDERAALEELFVVALQDGNPALRRAAADALLVADDSVASTEALGAYALRSFGGRPVSGGPIPTDFNEHEAFTLGRLAVRSPARFAGDAAAVIGDAFSLASLQAARGLAAEASHGTPPPTAVLEAMVGRIRRDETLFRSSAYLLDGLGKLAPHRLVSEPWESIWDGWTPDSKRALADALAVATQTWDEHAARRAGTLAEMLLDDGDFGVRRSAARALAKIESARLSAKCEEWIGSGSPTLRVRAAEAAAWVRPDDPRTIDNALQRRLLPDPERRVRVAAEASRRALRRRVSATAHLEDLTAAVNGDSNEWVLHRFATGSAMRRCGDETDVAALRSASRERTRPPHVRRFLRQVADDLEKQWKDVARKWPEPSRPWRGSIERCHGRVFVAGESLEAVVWLWLDAADDRPGEYARHRWGGTLRPVEQKPLWGLRLFMTDLSTTVRLELAGRVPTTANVVGIHNDEVTIRGTGDYPWDSAAGMRPS